MTEDRTGDYLDEYLDATEEVPFLGGTLVLGSPSIGEQRNLQAWVVANPQDVGGLAARCVKAALKSGARLDRPPDEWLRLIALAGEEGNVLTERGMTKCGFGVVHDRMRDAIEGALEPKAPEEPDDLPS